MGTPGLMDTRPQLERTAARAVVVGVLFVVGGTLLAGGLSAAVVVYLTKPQRLAT